MSDSNLVTTAIATGGTSFDTATCVSGKCEYPLQQYGNYAKLYSHQMIQTQNKYNPPALNSTLETYDATNAINGSKPMRSPFDDDSGAFFVGDSSPNNIGNGLVGFTRMYSTIPSEHTEPYGLYTRTLPAIGDETVTILSTEISNVNLKIEWLYSDGIYYQSRESGNQTDFDSDATTYVAQTYPSGASLQTGGTYSSNQWKQYDAVRGTYTFIYDNSSQDLFTNAKIKIYGNYSWSQSNYSGSGSAYANVYVKGNYNSYYNPSNQAPYNVDRDNYLNLGNTFTITSVTDNGDGTVTVVASTAPYDLSYIISSANSQIGSYWNYFHYTGHFGVEYVYYTGSTVTNYSFRYGLASITPTSREYELSGRSSAGEVNSASHLAYRYIKTDDPTTIAFTSKVDFPATISSSTTPNQQEYRDMIGTYVGAENEYIERYLGNIYRIAQIKTVIE